MTFDLFSLRESYNIYTTVSAVRRPVDHVISRWFLYKAISKPRAYQKHSTGGLTECLSVESTEPGCSIQHILVFATIVRAYIHRGFGQRRERLIPMPLTTG